MTTNATSTRTPGWDSVHRRTAALRDVVARLDRDDELAWDVEVFPERADVLVALHDVWSRRLLGRVDMALELQDPPEDAVAEAWRAVAADLRGVRRLLDDVRDHPALAAHERSEHRMIAVAVGRATLADPPSYSARQGHEFVARLRAQERGSGNSRHTGRWHRFVRSA